MGNVFVTLPFSAVHMSPLQCRECFTMSYYRWHSMGFRINMGAFQQITVQRSRAVIFLERTKVDAKHCVKQ